MDGWLIAGTTAPSLTGTSGGDLPSEPIGALAPRFAHYVKRPLERLLPFAFAIAVAGALAFGWLGREEQHLSPEEGTGYWLGIAGAVTMLMLLLYPLRKRIKALRHLGSVKSWFRAHMLLGILGPTLILFHANFGLRVTQRHGCDDGDARRGRERLDWPLPLRSHPHGTVRPKG